MKLAQALDAYRDAVARRAYWEDNGTRRDGNLEQAQANEASARAAVLKLVRGGQA